MARMWILALFLFVQGNRTIPQPCLSGDLESCKGAANAATGSYRLNGKITVDKGETPLVDVKLKNDQGVVLQTVLSFANGTFHFDGVSLGRYTVEIVDSRYNLATV